MSESKIGQNNNFMEFKPKRVSFLANVVASDDEPFLDTVDVSNTLKYINDTYPDEIQNYEHIMAGEFKTDPYIFFGTDYFAEYRKEEQKESERLNGPDLNELPDSVYSCSRCRSRKILTTQEQIRSGDEGATTIYHCKNCDHSWR